MRKKVILACTECHNRNYSSYKNSESESGRLEIKKYCKHCGKHTLHQETK
ncbi:50S ribosomal protein L33 [Salinibacillus xinjiangensis]|uniref:Large ribosomal subunit protein bL33 n=1 Tax=Salinibacillus xinjiangensis TaxID=1229268 RepID=A0A6G1XAP9_9BACI|nr:50S ribosomal protein L33 [Salinibacillus xinjiangensis]MRG87999.1 50S ribosomal protein L33 [Salinibacillus xinjiangensis]